MGNKQTNKQTNEQTKQEKVTLTPYDQLTDEQKQHVNDLGLFESTYKELVEEAKAGRLHRQVMPHDNDFGVGIKSTRDDLEWYLPPSVISNKATSADFSHEGGESNDETVIST